MPYSENHQFSMLKFFSDLLNYLLFLQSYLQNYLSSGGPTLTIENTIFSFARNYEKILLSAMNSKWSLKYYISELNGLQEPGFAWPVWFSG